MQTAKYYLYRNLHTGTFSIKYKGKVIKHPSQCLMHNVIFKVSVKGQARVRKELRKNVHATVVGTHFTEDIQSGIDLTKYQEIYYNPYKTDTFIDSAGQPIYKADQALCLNNKIYIKKHN